jgi:glycosyltransferase involved in cell wall biosynthesis
LNEEELFKYLSVSKIFLSFSDLEGFGLPPLEAALSGNMVIGYTGEGGKEYWKNPLFQEVPKGNILEFSKQVLNFIKKNDQHWYKKVKRYRQKLLTTYSRKNEIICIKKMLEKINYSYSK